MLVKSTALPDPDGPHNMLRMGNLGTISPSWPCLQVCSFKSMGLNLGTIFVNVIYIYIYYIIKLCACICIYIYTHTYISKHSLNGNITNQHLKNYLLYIYIYIYMIVHINGHLIKY